MNATAAAVFERYFLETRCKLLEIAANLDRLDRAEGDVAGDPRRAAIDDALRILLSSDANRAEQLQMRFSRPYDERWLKEFPVSSGNK